ncbi:MAG TPA: hypothetical protein VG605_16695 [Puia sp.]|nr:hypothetical protein [Puia sp.]
MSTQAKKEEKKHLTNEEIKEKADKLADQLGFGVFPICFIEAGEQIIGFVKEPSRLQKIAVMDKAMMGGYSAAEEILKEVVLKEHSDLRILSEKPEHDKIYIGAVMAVYDRIKFSTNTLKKN